MVSRDGMAIVMMLFGVPGPIAALPSTSASQVAGTVVCSNVRVRYEMHDVTSRKDQKFCF